MDVSKINQMLGVILDPKNPLGLNKSQINELVVMFNILKNLLEDGIQEDELVKLINLAGNLKGKLPSNAVGIKDCLNDFIEGLNELKKDLFDMDDDPTGVMNLLSDPIMRQKEIGDNIGDEDTINKVGVIDTGKSSLSVESNAEANDNKRYTDEKTLERLGALAQKFDEELLEARLTDDALKKVEKMMNRLTAQPDQPKSVN